MYAIFSSELTVISAIFLASIVRYWLLESFVNSTSLSEIWRILKFGYGSGSFG